MGTEKVSRKPRAAVVAAETEAGNEGGAEGKVINLALQGGGAHGAFGWGVMDQFLEDGRLSIEGVSGTSAGSMNAVVHAYGKINGNDGASEALHNFWKAISDAGQLNPRNYNPLREVLESPVDFEELERRAETKLFTCATNVRTGKARVFHTSEITSEVILASACLPHVFQAVEIEGEYYWDGGYMGNPVLYPLCYETESEDVVILHVNPIERPGPPKISVEISN